MVEVAGLGMGVACRDPHPGSLWGLLGGSGPPTWTWREGCRSFIPWSTWPPAEESEPKASGLGFLVAPQVVHGVLTPHLRAGPIWSRVLAGVTGHGKVTSEQVVLMPQDSCSYKRGHLDTDTQGRPREDGGRDG